MKRLINPPIQLLLWLCGIALLGVAGWNVWQLRLASVDHAATASVKVEIPDASALAVPPVKTYRKLVEAPLFWVERTVPKKVVAQPVVVQKAPEVVEVELNPPQGRLVGLVDLGDKMYALVRNEDQNQSLYKGDAWEGWTVAEITAEKLVLVAGKQRTEVALIGDFSAPKENQQIAIARKRQEQRKRHEEIKQQRMQQARQAQNGQTGDEEDADNGPTAAELLLSGQLEGVNPEGSAEDSEQRPTPVLSIKEALEARQRLMASRWGSQPKKEGQ